MADEEVPTTPESSEAGAVATVEPPELPALATPVESTDPGEVHKEAMRTRVVIPFVLPLIMAGAVFVYVINLSRALLAGGKWGSLAIASIITLLILIGAAFISAHPRLRTSTLVMLVSGLFVLIVASGLTSIGPSSEKETAATGYQQPSAAPTSTVTVTALPTLKFDATNYTAKAGVVQINYVDGGGTHTLVIDNPKYNGFELAVPGGPKSGKVDFTPGTYTIYCTIPGHRQAGMQATITVS